MIVWLLIGGILCVLAALLSIGGREDEREANPVTHYKRQLAELADDAQKKKINSASAAAARLEIERRILKLADFRTGQASVQRSGFTAILLLVGFVTLGSLGLYSLRGNPAIASKTSQRTTALDQKITTDGQSFGEAIAGLEERLRAVPDDKKALEFLATTSRQVQAFAKAANAYAALAVLEPGNSRWRVQQLEAFIGMANGQITPAATLILQKILADEPHHPAGQYYQALASLQSGDQAAAVKAWQDLKARSRANAPWMAAVNRQLSALGVLPPAVTQQQVDSIAAMSAEEQDTFIQAMIDRLKARLESAPQNPEGWLMLARSQASIGEKKAAIETINRAFSFISAENRPELQALLDNLLRLPNS